MTKAPLPQAVQAAAEEAWRRRRHIPGFAVLCCPGQPTAYKRHKLLTVGDCEQLTEQHKRRADAALARLRKRPTSAAAIRTAVEHIFRANLYAARYFELLGQEPGPDDLPFPLPAGEAKRQ